MGHVVSLTATQAQVGLDSTVESKGGVQEFLMTSLKLLDPAVPEATEP